MQKQQKLEHKLNMLRATGIISAAVLGAAAFLVIFLVKPGRSQAESSFKIDADGVLISYDVTDGMTQVSVPNTVTAIADGAFMGDRTLERINIPSGVKVIGEKAFYRCNHLMEIILPEGIEEVKDSAFGMCTNMSMASLPASLRKMGNGVFAGNSALYKVSLAEGNGAFFLNDGVIYDKDSTEIIQFIPGRRGDVYEMPFTVTSIRPYAFWGASNLKRVYVSNQVTSIPPFAFTNSASLEFAYLPNSVLSVQEYAFRDCGRLVYVGAESTLTTADTSSFEGVKKLTAEVGVSKVRAEERYIDALENSDETEDADPENETYEDSNSAVNENASSADNNSDRSSGSSTGKDKSGSKSNGENEEPLIFGTPWGINAPYKEIDTSEDNLYGYGKIVGGSTFIMPTGKVSGNGK
ncbi:Leucine rich repeat-containing protein [Lachnospiraceae bacterium]|nr:Leucine rich repeat-containing protein [Lachnospiraceae bacterium]